MILSDDNQATAIKHSLITLLPEEKDQIQEDFESLKNELLELDNNIQRIVSTDQDKPLLASHPVYQYLAKRYSLNLKSMHWESDKMPSIDQWQKLINILETHSSKWMIWENTPINDTKEKLESLGISSIVFNPSGNAPEKGDYMSVMYQNVENLSIVFEQVPEKSSP